MLRRMCQSGNVRKDVGLDHGNYGRDQRETYAVGNLAAGVDLRMRLEYTCVRVDMIRFYESGDDELEF